MQFLTNYIETHEVHRGSEPAEDQAEEFLEFVRRRAGLIIEAGDGFYSFVHLTFQEYLTATHLITQSEKDGLSSVWHTIGDQISEPRWHEVIRLLVASLKSDEGQRYLIEQLLATKGIPTKSQDILLTGLLVDGIGSAEEREVEILNRVIDFSRRAKTSKDFADITGLVRAWLLKDTRHLALFETLLLERISTIQKRSTLALQLLGTSMGLLNLNKAARDDDRTEQEILLHALTQDQTTDAIQNRSLDKLWHNLDAMALVNPFANAAAVCGLAVCAKLLPNDFAKQSFRRQLIVLRSGYGPNRDHTLNLVLLAANGHAPLPKELLAAAKSACSDQQKSAERHGARKIRRLFESGGLQRRERPIPVGIRRRRPVGVDMNLYHLALLDQVGKNSSSHLLTSAEFLSDGLIPTIVETLSLRPEPHWTEALKFTLSRSVPDILAKLLDSKTWKPMLGPTATPISENDAYFLAWLLLLDIWVHDEGEHHGRSKFPFAEIAEFAKTRSEPVLGISLALRNCALGISGETEPKFTEDDLKFLASLSD